MYAQDIDCARGLNTLEVTECSEDKKISASNVFNQMWDQNVLSDSAVVLLLHHSRTFMFLILKGVDILIDAEL